jgi:uncharacterized membrane protein YoaK (UPF0700 family)
MRMAPNRGRSGHASGHGSRYAEGAQSVNDERTYVALVAGMAVGVAIGVAIGNVVMGIAIGVAIGLALGIAVASRDRR